MNKKKVCDVSELAKIRLVFFIADGNFQYRSGQSFLDEGAIKTLAAQTTKINTVSKTSAPHV